MGCSGEERVAHQTHLEDEPATEVHTAHFGGPICERRVDGIVREDGGYEDRGEDGDRRKEGAEGNHGRRGGGRRGETVDALHHIGSRRWLRPCRWHTNRTADWSDWRNGDPRIDL